MVTKSQFSPLYSICLHITPFGFFEGPLKEPKAHSIIWLHCLKRKLYILYFVALHSGCKTVSSGFVHYSNTPQLFFSPFALQWVKDTSGAYHFSLPSTSCSQEHQHNNPGTQSLSLLLQHSNSCPLLSKRWVLSRSTYRCTRPVTSETLLFGILYTLF